MVDPANSDRLGMCPNIGNCRIADERQRLALASIADGCCPSCGRSLLPIVTTEEPPQRRRRRGRPLFWSVALAAVVGVLVTGHSFAPGPQPPAEAPIAMTLAGSNTIGARLARAWAAAFLVRKGYVDTAETEVRLDEVLITGRRKHGGEAVSILVKAHGSATGFAALSTGEADIAMASRPIEDREVADLARLGDMRAASNEHVVAMDGVAVIVHRANPVARLSLAQLGEVFAGKVTSWSQLGGPALPIKVYARDDRSGTWDTFRSVVLTPARLDLATAAQRFEDSKALADAVAADPGGIGFVGLPYVGPTRAVAVSPEIKGRAIYPNRFTVATEEYPLARRLYLYASVTPGPLVNELLTFVMSRDGQEIVEKQDFVALTLEGLPSLGVSDQPDYTKRTAGYMRLSTNFHFRSGSLDLDSKGSHDLDGVVDYIARSGKRTEVMLLGFADNSGDTTANAELSRLRASSVARELAARGVPVGQSIGMGAELPVASNETAEGRDRNRRVEILVKGLN